MSATSVSAIGRRERKKAATRAALADAALRMFLERGYDNVTVREIADAADVSTTTLLKHFPSKEALVFDRDTELEAALVGAVTDRPAGVSVPRALRDYIARTRIDLFTTDERDEFLDLVRATPALSEYWHKMLMRHQDALARAIAAETSAPSDDPRCAALAHFALEASALAGRAADPLAAVYAAFDLLERGWGAGAGDGV
ncbi:helix-turn-helix domain-containing protein [Actinacidiphila sp. DG2A-62]|uniref:TetR/AcrR family transcriptional regulator n=1 Tax=Actinacidiphila sp. DG2A-62 TaxID=3108821 RepID=UPI002DBF4873|nr:helix-turn-helix domain-containing protein [Actinacidiphila sp. DG2A-62]MEC3997328.1 helix-turn-helix domain-containing protein [Actinacidiphila sp. DG2A-62]